ncbi:MAG TPA: deoxyguanosinetriphosphate triphosphohydrolase, partial [Anaerolineales bacterium]|nr:deoxyguanosinetriphosphate triphosphohydrolase [Anaerolineales bacterium]
ALNKLMKEYGRFDHNKQSLRIVTKLEKRYPDFDGLNLSWEVLEGMVKHETEYDISDASEYDPDLRGHLEAQIANIADELAYTAHDLDDGLRSGMISPLMLSGIEIWEILRETTGWKNNQLTDLNRHRIIRRLIGILVTDVVDATSKTIDAAGLKSANDLQKLDHNVAGYSTDTHRRNREIKDFLYNELYRHHRVVRMAKKAERTITELFNAYQEEPSMLDERYQGLIEQRGLERTICDYIAGMTDRYAIEEYQKLFDPQTLP